MRVQAASTGTISKDGSWSFPLSDTDSPVGYFLLQGQAEVTIDDRAAESLKAGDLLVVIRSKSHRLYGSKPVRPVQAENDEQSEKTSFLFAIIQAQIASDCPFGSAMPDHFLFRSGERTESPHLDAQLQCLVWEAKSGAAASKLMQARLWEIVFMQAFRVHLAKTKTTTGWLSAICDQQLSKVLAAILRYPERDWTVEMLAAEAAISRATLARRFASVLNDTPMDYLFKQRMRMAAARLREPGASISMVAQQVGYSSESAFSSAFHRRFNIWPGEYRNRESISL